MIYQISSSQGPGECEPGIEKFLEYLKKNYDITVLDFLEGYCADTFCSVRFSSPDDLSGFVGSVQWVWQSTYRADHKLRINFLISAFLRLLILRTSMKDKSHLKLSEAVAMAVRMLTRLRWVHEQSTLHMG